MLEHLFHNAHLLQEALQLESIFVKGMEFKFDNLSDERADLVFQDKWGMYGPKPDTTLFVLELKSGTGDHEIVGQLKKAVQVMRVRERVNKHWHRTVGVAVARKYTRSGLELLWAEGYRVFEYHGEEDNVRLIELKSPQPVKRAITKEALESMDKDANLMKN